MNEIAKHEYELIKSKFDGKGIVYTANDKLLQINCVSNGLIHQYDTCIAFVQNHDVIRCTTVLGFKIKYDKIAIARNFCNGMRDIYCHIDEDGISTIYFYVPYKKEYFEKYGYTALKYDYEFLETFLEKAEKIYDIAYMINNDIPGFEDIVNDNIPPIGTDDELELFNLIKEYKSNPTQAIYEKIKTHNAYIVGAIQNNNNSIEAVSTDDGIVVFCMEIEALDYIYTEHKNKGELLKCVLCELLKYSNVYFKNGNVTLNKEGENI